MRTPSMAQTLYVVCAVVWRNLVVRRAITALVGASDKMLRVFVHPSSCISAVFFYVVQIYAFLLCTTSSFRHRAVSLCASCFGLLCACFITLTTVVYSSRGLYRGVLCVRTAFSLSPWIFAGVAELRRPYPQGSPEGIAGGARHGSAPVPPALWSWRRRHPQLRLRIDGLLTRAELC